MLIWFGTGLFGYIIWMLSTRFKKDIADNDAWLEEFCLFFLLGPIGLLISIFYILQMIINWSR